MKLYIYDENKYTFIKDEKIMQSQAYHKCIKWRKSEANSDPIRNTTHE